MVNFYSRAIASAGMDSISKKLTHLSEKTKIKNRYSCIPDFNGSAFELFTDDNFNQSVERRTAIYKEKILPLATNAIDKLLNRTKIESKEITHLITVSCTGLFAPGFEFLAAEYYGLQHTEKLALNFLGCYAAIKALKHAHYIAEANPEACILIVSAELCSLHFYPSVTNEDIVANLIFADGAAAVIVCGNDSSHVKNKVVLNIGAIGSAYIPDTLDLMTWDISSSAFRMFLSKHLVKAIKDNIEPLVNNFLDKQAVKTDYWAIHPGGVRIVEAVKDQLGLTENDTEDSMSILEEYGNMSSPTILFIIDRIFKKIKKAPHVENKNIFTCAFGPGLTIEMIYLSSVDTSNVYNQKYLTKNHAVQV